MTLSVWTEWSKFGKIIKRIPFFLFNSPPLSNSPTIPGTVGKKRGYSGFEETDSRSDI
jgi:hypothetical protein